MSRPSSGTETSTRAMVSPRCRRRKDWSFRQGSSRNAGLSARSSAADGGRFGGRINHVARALTALLANAHIDNGQRKRCRLHDAAGGVAASASAWLEKAPVGDSVKIDEDVGVRARCRESTSALNEREASRIGIGINEDDLPWRIGSSAAKNASASALVSRRMVTGCHAATIVGGVSDRSSEPPARAIEQRGAAQMVERGRSGAMHAPGLFAHRDHAQARCFRRRKVQCASLVRALRTASSMAPWLTSPPSM
jgi:hypothetical protein